MNPINTHQVSNTPEIKKEPVLSTEEIRRKIESINADQISILAIRMAENVLNSIGPINKASIALQVSELKEPNKSHQTDVMLKLIMFSAKKAIEKDEPFLSENDSGKFLEEIHTPIEKKIKESFAVSERFIERGLLMRFSDYEPLGMLDETAKKLNIKLTALEVPKKYKIIFKLDEEQTKEQSELVFHIIECSEGVEFSKSTFTLKNLEDNFRKEMESIFP